MNFLSCYKWLAPRSIQGGLGQGGGFYWQEDVGIMLQARIARLFGATIEYDPRPHGRDSFDVQQWTPPAGDFECAYCQLFDLPTKRPAKFVWSIISDYVGMEDLLENWLISVRPNLLVTFQYPTGPVQPIASMPNLQLRNLSKQCERHGCKVVYLPWFNTRDIDVNWTIERDIPVMCTGKMSGTYPARDSIYRYLKALDIPGAIVSGNPTGSEMKLSTEQYREALLRCRYYVTGGIYDFQIPPKYYEICNYGATLVSFPLPMMEQSGFIAGETFVEITSLTQIPSLLESDVYKTVGPAGKRMARERHSIGQRALQIHGALSQIGVGKA